MSGAQGQSGAAPANPVAPTGDLAPMQQFQSYKSAPDRAAWMQQNQTQAQPVQPWQPPQRMYAQPNQGSGMMKGVEPYIDRMLSVGLNGDLASYLATYQALKLKQQQGAK